MSSRRTWTNNRKPDHPGSTPLELPFSRADAQLLPTFPRPSPSKMSRCSRGRAICRMQNTPSVCWTQISRLTSGTWTTRSGTGRASRRRERNERVSRGRQAWASKDRIELTIDRQMFLNSVLSELRGQELAVSTDPDTAVVLERLMPSLGDWGRRVIGDAFGDSWDVLIRHRFGSHVAQTWFTLAADTLDREVRPVLIVNQDCF